MGKVQKVFSAFPVIGCVLANLSAVLYIAGFSSSYWLHRTNYPEGYIGLWSSCVEELVEQSDNSSTVEIICYDTKDHAPDDWNTDWVTGTRALAIIALITMVMVAVLSSMYACSNKLSESVALLYSTLCTCFAAYFTMLTSVIIPGVKRFDDFYNGYFLGWGFALTTTASCITLFCIVVLFMELARLNDRRVRKRLQCPGNALFNRQKSQIVPKNENHNDREVNENHYEGVNENHYEGVNENHYEEI